VTAKSYVLKRRQKEVFGEDEKKVRGEKEEGEGGEEEERKERVFVVNGF